MNVGGYQLNDYVSRPDLGTVVTDMVIDLFHNTFHQYGGLAIGFFTDLTFRYGNNLFTGGGSDKSINAGVEIDAGGNQFITEAEADYVDAANFDFRIKQSSLAAAGGVDYSDDYQLDYNFNPVINTTFAGANKPGGKLSLSHYINAINYVAQANPYTEFQWYFREAGQSEWAKVPGANGINFTPQAVTQIEYRLGIKVKDVNGKVGRERFGPVFFSGISLTFSLSTLKQQLFNYLKT